MKRWVIAIVLVLGLGLLGHLIIPYLNDARVISVVKYYTLRNQALDPAPLPREKLKAYLSRVYNKEKGQSVDWQIKRHQSFVEIWAVLPPTGPDQKTPILKWSRTYENLPIVRTMNKAAARITPELYDQALQGALPE
mgnify:CR=1 FL=1